MGYQKLTYYCNCVGWPCPDVNSEGGLCDMIDNAIEITRSTFLLHVDRDNVDMIEHDLGYSRHSFLMSKDYAVSYHRSKLHGRRVYFFRHSCIEYVFTS